MTPRTLSSTTCPLVAGWCGYDAPSDPIEDGYGYTLTQDGDEFTLLGPDGEVKFSGAEAQQIVEALIDAMRFRKEAA